LYAICDVKDIVENGSESFTALQSGVLIYLKYQGMIWYRPLRPYYFQ